MEAAVAEAVADALAAAAAARGAEGGDGGEEKRALSARDKSPRGRKGRRRKNRTTARGSGVEGEAEEGGGGDDDDDDVADDDLNRRRSVEELVSHFHKMRPKRGAGPSPGPSAGSPGRGGASAANQVSVFFLCTVTCYANRAHNLTRSPSHL